MSVYPLPKVGPPSIKAMDHSDTTLGHRRAFVQFQEVDHAVAFMKEHFPKLLVQLTHSTDDVPDGRFDAYIHYARSRESREEMDARALSGNDWTCPTVRIPVLETRLDSSLISAISQTTQHEQNARSVVGLRVVRQPFDELEALTDPAPCSAELATEPYWCYRCCKCAFADSCCLPPSPFCKRRNVHK